MVARIVRQGTGGRVLPAGPPPRPSVIAMSPPYVPTVRFAGDAGSASRAGGLAGAPDPGAMLAARMGQPISVVRKPTTTPALVRFEINRTLTGTGHERYRADVPVSGERPPDELARRLFEHGGITSVHIH